VDLVRASLGETAVFPPWVSALMALAAAFVALARLFHRRRRWTGT
jgi:hypothetical protein